MESTQHELNVFYRPNVDISIINVEFIQVMDYRSTAKRSKHLKNQRMVGFRIGWTIPVMKAGLFGFGT